MCQKIFEKSPEPEEQYYPWILENLAEVYIQQESYKKAVIYAEQSKELLEKLHKTEDDHLNVGLGVFTLSRAKYQLGEYVEAEKLTERCLKIFKKHLGINDVMTIRAIIQMGSILAEQDKFKKAEEFIKEHILEVEKVKERKEDFLLSLLHHLGCLLFEKGNYTEVEQYWLRASDLAKAQGYAQHVLCDLATLYWASGRDDDARAMEEKIKEINDKEPVPIATSKYIKTKTVALDPTQKPQKYKIQVESLYSKRESKTN